MFPMTRRLAISAIAVALTVSPAAADLGPAPGFTLENSKGAPVSLSDFAGKRVVLEWTNHGCPYVQKHYGIGNMQALQRRAAADGTIWLSVISSRPGAQGHVSGLEADQLTETRNATPTHVLFDPAGAVGRAYGAKTTPQMVVIDESGNMVYNGALDDEPGFQSSLDGVTNYVTAALDALNDGRSVEVAQTRPYGCSVKY